MASSLDAQLALADLRLRVLERKSITRDEFRQVMRALREDRNSAARNAAASKRVAAKAIGSTKVPQLSLDTLFPSMSAKGDEDGTVTKD